MKKIKTHAVRSMKYTAITILLFVLFIGLYITSAILISKIAVDPEPAENANIDLYIITNGVHTDLVVPIKTDQIDWSTYIKFDNTLAKDSSYKFVALGWGDKGFYLETPTWGDLTFNVAFKAAFGLSNSAIHATFYHSIEDSENSIHLKLTEEQYKRLIDYTLESLQLSEVKELTHIKTTANYGVNDAFYEANGSYSFYHTCNSWANTGLKTCGQKACVWTIFDTGIFNQYKD